jgi:prepilin-type N-terminal cleavage/methylation domain-containing protein
MLNRNGFTLVELIMCIGILCIILLFPVIVIWTDGNIEWWIYYLKGEVINIPWWISTIITIVLNGVAIAFNIITELCKIVL